jgi:lysophospholipase L1-like esterase
MTQHSDSIVSQGSRREFIHAGLGLGAAGLALLANAGEISAAEEPTTPKRSKPLIEPGNTVLFQGDSITDGGRDRRRAGEANSFAALGTGYAWIAAAQLLVDKPDSNLKIYNRGVSGNKVYQLAERWQADCLDIKPDVLSILIGVNDFAHHLKGDFAGTVETYAADYAALIKRTKDALPKVKLIICEPFALTVGTVNDKWFPAYNGYRAAARRIADETGAVFVPFQTMFDRAIKLAPPAHWAADGVHPTPSGAALMAHGWLSAVGA